MVPKPTLLASVEEFFVRESEPHIDRIGGDKSSTSFFDFFDEFLIDSIEIVTFETFAVGRIGDYGFSLFGIRKVIMNLENDIISDSSAFRISFCDFDHLIVHI